MRTIGKVIKNILSPVALLDMELEELTRNILLNSVKTNSHWLDVGCGLKPFESSFSNAASYQGIDVEVSGRDGNLKRPDKFFDGVHIPYDDGIFDGVLCTQVLEHVAELDLLLAECNRVLKVGGTMIVTVPFVYREHEQPYDFRRFTSYGLMMNLSRYGFKVESCLKYLSAIETIATLFCVYISNIGSRSKFLYLMTGCFISFPVLRLSKLLAKFLPDRRDLFCGLIACSVKTKKSNGERY